MTVTERYVGQVQRALFCTPLHRKKFIRDLEPLAEDFASGNPKAALADFRREFGTPEALARLGWLQNIRGCLSRRLHWKLY